MDLASELAKKFEENMRELIEREKKEPSFLSQEGFDNCKDRAKAAIDMAAEPVTATLAYAIAVHREKEHKDNTIEEQSVLLAQGADPEVGTRSWWNP